MTDNYGEEISVFPNPLPLKEPIDDNHLIPGLIGSVYLETLAAYNSKSYILCAMGLRSIIEAICIDRKCKMERNLKLSIEKLRNSGNISELQVDILQNCKDFLNITFHEIKKPSRAEITAAFGAIESILASVYIHPETGEYLRKRHQRRKGSPIS
jgi:hypothetical protein